MKGLKFIMSVTTLVMTLFLLCILNNTEAASVKYPEGYTPLTANESYVDEIKFNNAVNLYNKNNFVNYSLMAKNLHDRFTITRTRTITGETNTNVLITEAIFELAASTFTVYYNGEVYFSMIFYYEAVISNFEYEDAIDINFNDPNDKNYQNVERVLISAPTTEVSSRDIDNFDLSKYEGYEDFILLKTYEVTEIQEIVDSPINLPSKDVLIKSDIELSSGLKIEGKDNICYGGNYNLEEGKTIEKGLYYLKVTTFYNDIQYNIIYKITVSDMISELPRIYISSKRQLTDNDINNHITENNILNYTYDASTYYEHFNNPGIYYIHIDYTYGNKKYNAKFAVYVLSEDNQRLKIKDNSKLKLGYNELLAKEEFEDNLDFSYIEVDEYDIDYSIYENNYNSIGKYDICINIKDIYGILYIQVYTIEVYDNICPNVDLDENIDLSYSYEDRIDIEKIISYLDISDVSEYSIKYNADDYLNRTTQIGEFIINAIITDTNLNETTYPIKIKIIDDVKPKLITKPVYASTNLMLDNNTIKSYIYARDEIDGTISNDLIEINDINRYKDNYDIPGTYHFEVIVRDNSGNEAYGSFDLIVTDEIIENIDVINVDKNNPFTKDEILSYLIEKGYLEEGNYELTSNYFELDNYDDETYSLEVTNKDNNEKSYFEIKINDSNVVYDSIVIEEDDIQSSNGSIFIIISIIAVILVTSGILGVIIYKKKH